MEKFFNIIKIFLKIIAMVVIGGALAVGILFIYYWSIDNIFKNVLPFTSRAVLANFILFAAILVSALWAGAKAPNQIQKMQDDVVESIETSKTAKTDSEAKLGAVEESLIHLEDDISAILAESEERAQLVGTNILEDAKKTALAVKDNANKAFENSALILKNDLIRRAAYASVEVAKAHIIEELNRNSDLHKKLIDESIDAIEGVEL